MEPYCARSPYVSLYAQHQANSNSPFKRKGDTPHGNEPRPVHRSCKGDQRRLTGTSQALPARSVGCRARPVNLLLELEQGVPVEALRAVGAPIGKMRDRLRSYLESAPRLDSGPAQLFVTPRAASMLRRAEAEAQRLNDEYIGAEHLLIAIVQEDKGDTARLLAESNVDLEQVYQRPCSTYGEGIALPTPEPSHVTARSTSTASTLHSLPASASWIPLSDVMPRLPARSRR